MLNENIEVFSKTFAAARAFTKSSECVIATTKKIPYSKMKKVISPSPSIKKMKRESK